MEYVFPSLVPQAFRRHFLSIRRLRGVLPLFLALLPATAGASSPWLFLPTFKHQITGLQQTSAQDATVGAMPLAVTAFVARTAEIAEAEKSMLFWREASFPHQDFVKLMPQKNVFGWYAHVFDLPDEFVGFDLLLDLGIIDDADETFLNGALIGKTGTVPGGSAWNRDRLYRIPAELIKTEANVLTSHVWSLWGLGGIVGPPVLKAALVPANAQWELAFIKDEKAPSPGLNHAVSVDEALTLCFGGSTPVWQKAAIPWTGWKSYPDDAHFAVFRSTLDLPKTSDETARFRSPVVLDIGPIFDVGAVFLNDKRLGLTGRFPENGEPAFTEAARRGQYLVAPQDWNVNSDNHLTVIIYRERGIGGLPGVPGNLLENPVSALRRNPYGKECFTAFDILHQSQKYDEAEHILDEARPDNDLDRVWLLSHRAHLAWLRWLDGERNEKMLDGVLSPTHEILTKYTVESPKQSAMQAFCQVLRLAEKNDMLLAIIRRYFPDFSRDCIYLEPDRMTKGDWPLFYGAHSYVLAAMGQICDWSGGIDRVKYKLHIPGRRDTPRYWLDWTNRFLDAPAALLIPGLYEDKFESALDFYTVCPVNGGHLFPGEKIRRAAWWDDHGETHPFDDAGPDIELHASESKNNYCLSTYHMDPDWRNTRHPRQQSVLLYSQNGTIINATWSGKIDSGIYERFSLFNRNKVKFRFNKHRGACVAVSGLFVDLPPLLPEMVSSQASESMPYLLVDNNSPKKCQKNIVRLSGNVSLEIASWYDKMREAQGLVKYKLAAEYTKWASELMSEEAGDTGKFIYIGAAETAFDTPNAIPLFMNSISLKYKSPNELTTFFTEVLKFRNQRNCWLFFLTSHVLEQMSNTIDYNDAIDQLYSLALICETHATMPIQQACLSYMKKYGATESNQKFMYIQRNILHSKGTITRKHTVMKMP
ncbi:MAG: hypothetical protein WCR33_04965 [Bacilli bacterium]